MPSFVSGAQWAVLSVIGSLGLSVMQGCATSPLGRRQLVLVSDSQMSQMGSEAFRQIREKSQVETDSKINAYVKCIVEPLAAEYQKESESRTQRQGGRQSGYDSWEISVFRDPQANAFALPGGKIGVYTGILKVAKTDAQLAAVIGHEIGHVIARHGAERVSQQAGTQLGLEALGILTRDNPNRRLLLGLLGIGAQVGVLLPFSRVQEREADLIGQELMALAGFDPRESVELWRNMEKETGGQKIPEFLSTHPASESRIKILQDHLTQTLPEYKLVKASSQVPNCSIN